MSICEMLQTCTTVAVGMTVTGHPPHRPVLAGTTAYGSYLGYDPMRGLASKRSSPEGVHLRTLFRAHHAIPGSPLIPHSVGRVLDSMVFSLVPGLPSTTSAASVPTGSVRRLRGYYARVRLLVSVHDQIVLMASWSDPPYRRGCRRGLSVLARAVSRRAHGSWTTPGLT